MGVALNCQLGQLGYTSIHFSCRLSLKSRVSPYCSLSTVHPYPFLAVWVCCVAGQIIFFFHLITKFAGNLRVYLWAKSVNGLKQSTLRSHDDHIQNHQCRNTQSGENHSPLLSAKVNSCPWLHEIAPSISTTIRSADWPKGWALSDSAGFTFQTCT